MSEYKLTVGELPQVLAAVSKANNVGIYAVSDLILAHAEIAEITKEVDELRGTLNEIDHCVSEVYTTLTDAKFGKCNTDPIYIIECVRRIQQEEYGDIEKERDEALDLLSNALKFKIDGVEIEYWNGRWRENCTRRGLWTAHNTQSEALAAVREYLGRIASPQQS